MILFLNIKKCHWPPSKVDPHAYTIQMFLQIQKYCMDDPNSIGGLIWSLDGAHSTYSHEL